MSKFKPTWLYIKQHQTTGLKYFGKTTTVDPYTYNGSGKYWKKHLQAHGYDISTVWCRLFTNKSELTEYSINFSKEHNIVESAEWANLKIENGLDGAPIGTKMTAQTKEKISAGNLGKVVSESTRQKMKGRVFTEETKQKISAALTGRVRGPVSEETRQKMIAGHKTATRVISDEVRKRKSELMKNYRHSDEVKEKMRKPKGPMAQLTCKYCNRTAGANYINRAHNDKCIKKINIS
jgi:hypothetical protein